MAQGKSTRLTAADWTRAGLDALAEGGLAAVAVEPIAGRLGATKGSFYWHFADRRALVEAVLAAWTARDTVGVIMAADREPDPGVRLRRLLGLVLRSAAEPRGGAAVEVRLRASAGDPLVAPVLAEVTGRRMAYLTDAFAELGLARAEAARRALLAYTTYLGHAQLAAATPQVLPTGRALAAYVDHVAETLVGERPGPTG